MNLNVLKALDKTIICTNIKIYFSLFQIIHV